MEEHYGSESQSSVAFSLPSNHTISSSTPIKDMGGTREMTRCYIALLANKYLLRVKFAFLMTRARISMHYETLKHACIHALSND